MIGNMVADPEKRTTQNGISQCTFKIAVQRRGGKEADFFTVVAWRQTADFVGKYMTKGRKVVVSGELQTRSYEKDGQKHTVVEINAQTVEALDRGPQKPSDGFMEVTPDDLPF